MKNLISFLLLIFALLSCENKIQKGTNSENIKSQTTQTEESSKPNTNLENNITSFCNFAKIIDKDGFVNVREKNIINSKIIGKIKSGEVVYIFEDSETDWLDVSFKDQNNKELTGFVHRSRIKYINTLEQIPSVIEDENGVNFILKDIVVEIKTDKFNYELNEKYYTKDKQGFDKYKGKFMLGTDGYISEIKTFYKSISTKIGQQILEIPQQEIEDLFNANNEYAECFYDESDKSLYIHLSNSDGSGSYVTLLKIQNNTYKGRYVEIPF
jgi:hypothetical protein